ncbi:MAG: SpoIVB peptidase S55 domain-containing protein [Candidatus Bipolaricaulota bacterium]
MIRTYFVALATILLAAAGAAGGDYIALDEVTPGMTGHGLTVVAGEELVEFQVEVVAVITEPGVRQEFIVIRALGEAIERSGGIAQGMSGSPVYLDGRLAGALSRAAAWAAEPERPLGLVTPIEDMRKVLDEVVEEDPPLPELPRIKPDPPSRHEASSWETQLAGSPLYTWPLQAPVLTAGLSERAVQTLNRGLELGELDSPLTRLLPSWADTIPGLEELGISQVITAPGVAGHTDWELRPGGPVGVSLMVGDMRIGALGTVTDVHGEAMVAMGHHFLFSGPSRYFLTEAHILDTVQALDTPFKYGTLGAVEGGILADRWAAVGGRTDLPPAGIELGFEVRAPGASQTQSYALEAVMAQEPRLQALLLYLAGLEATDRALDRIGEGTVTVSYELHGNGMPRPLSRENVFLSTDDIASYVPWEAAVILNVLEYNEFQEPGLTEVRLQAEVNHEFKATEITEFVVHGQGFKPGDPVPFTVYARDWRGEQHEWSAQLRIPPSAEGAYVEMRAYGGPRPLERGEAPPLIESLEELITYIEGIPANDTVNVELFIPAPLTELTGVEHLVGVDGRSLSVPDSVVAGEISVYIPLEQER